MEFVKITGSKRTYRDTSSLLMSSRLSVDHINAVMETLKNQQTRDTTMANYLSI